MIKRPDRLALTALVVGWLFDFLYWEKTPGISFAIFVALCLSAGFLIARSEEIRPAGASLWLLLPLSFFAVMSFVRMEPFTRFLNHAFTLMLMAMLANTFRGGRWTLYGVSDYIAGLFRLGVSAMGRFITAFNIKPNREEAMVAKPKRSRHVWAILRGLVIALPVLVIFNILLSAADPIFSQRMENFLDIFNIENIGEYIWRGFIILVLAYMLGGVYLHALLKSADENLIGEDKPWLSPYLGFTEAAVVLGSVCLLFTVFVQIQFQYFFGGESNIASEGFIYSTYARQGFFELLAVAFISLLLFLTLSAVARRDTPRQRKIFSGLGITLVLLVGVILVSAFQRLLLYENAYGFTRQRAYTHVFIVWLGLLLAGIIILEFLQRSRRFAFAMLISVLGFGVSLNLLNVDGLIVRQNVARAQEGIEIDVGYLISLSDDAIPALTSYLNQLTEDGALNDDLLSAVAVSLGCHAMLNDEYQSEAHWQSFHLARFTARRIWETQSGALSSLNYLPTLNEKGRWSVDLEGEEFICRKSRY